MFTAPITTSASASAAASVVACIAMVRALEPSLCASAARRGPTREMTVTSAPSAMPVRAAATPALPAPRMTIRASRIATPRPPLQVISRLAAIGMASSPAITDIGARIASRLELSSTVSNAMPVMRLASNSCAIESPAPRCRNENNMPPALSKRHSSGCISFTLTTSSASNALAALSTITAPAAM